MVNIIFVQVGDDTVAYTSKQTGLQHVLHIEVKLDYVSDSAARTVLFFRASSTYNF